MAKEAEEPMERRYHKLDRQDCGKLHNYSKTATTGETAATFRLKDDE